MNVSQWSEKTFSRQGMAYMNLERWERRSAEYLSDHLDLPEDALLQTMSIHLMGSRMMIVENFRNLLEYTDLLIRIQGKEGRLRIEGRCLCIREYHQETIRITGYIRQISFEQRHGSAGKDGA